MGSLTIEDFLPIRWIREKSEDYSILFNSPGLPSKIEKAFAASLLSLTYGKSTYGNGFSVWEPSISPFRKYIWIGQLILDFPALWKKNSNNESGLGQMVVYELVFNLGVPKITSWLGGPTGAIFSHLFRFNSNKVEKIGGFLMSAAIAFGVETLREKYFYNSYLFYPHQQEKERIRRTPLIKIDPYDQAV